MKDLKASLTDSMEKAIQTFKKQLAKVRTGRATPSILEGLMANYYGTPTPINQLGQISTPDARTLQIHPFDKSVLTEIEKVLLNANLGVTPTNDGNFVRLPFPALTEDKRKDLVKGVKKLGEESKVALRNLRRDFNEKIKKAEKAKEVSEDDSKKHQDEIQKITDTYIEQVDKTIHDKEKELLTI
ncbi:MAG: ribosome recycling factor [Oligoflexia bacterium]|nr:ribosome recycling factor [Oligoflexia bacterium]